MPNTYGIDHPWGTSVIMVNGSYLVITNPNTVPPSSNGGQSAVTAQAVNEASNASQVTNTPMPAEEKIIESVGLATPASYAAYVNETEYMGNVQAVEQKTLEILGGSEATILPNGAVEDIRGNEIVTGATYYRTPEGIRTIPAAGAPVEQAFLNIARFGSAAPGVATSPSDAIQLKSSNVDAAYGFLGKQDTGQRLTVPGNDPWAQGINALPTRAEQETFIARSDDPLARLSWYAKYGSQPVTVVDINKGLESRADFQRVGSYGDSQTAMFEKRYVAAGYDPVSARAAALEDQYRGALRTPDPADDRFYANERERAVQAGIALSSQASFEMSKGWIPYAGNPYESAGDTYLEMLKGYPTKGAEGPLSFTTPLPVFQGQPMGMQEVDWVQAVQRDRGQQVAQLEGTYHPAIALATARMGQIYPEVNIESRLGPFATIEGAVYRAGMSYAETGRIRVEPTAIGGRDAEVFYLNAPGMVAPARSNVQVKALEQKINQVPENIRAPFTSASLQKANAAAKEAESFDPLGAVGGFARSVLNVGGLPVSEALSTFSLVNPAFIGVRMWTGQHGAQKQENSQSAGLKSLETLESDYSSKARAVSDLESYAVNLPRNTRGEIVYDVTDPDQAAWAKSYGNAVTEMQQSFGRYDSQRAVLENQGTIRSTGRGQYVVASPFAKGYEFGEFSKWSEGAGKQLQAFFRLDAPAMESKAELPSTDAIEAFSLSAQAKVMRDPGSVLTSFTQGAMLGAAFVPSGAAATVGSVAAKGAGLGIGSRALNFALPAVFVGTTSYEVTSGFQDFSAKGMAIQGGKLAPDLGAMLAGGGAVAYGPRAASAGKSGFDRSSALFERTFSEKPAAMIQTVAERNIFMTENPLAVSGRALRVEETRTIQEFNRGKFLPSFFNPKATGNPVVAKSATVVDIESYAGARLVNERPQLGQLVAREYEISNINIAKPVLTGTLKPNQKLSIDLARAQGKPELYNVLGGVYRNAKWEKSTRISAERYTYGGVYEELVSEPMTIFRPYKVRQASMGTLETGATPTNIFEKGFPMQTEGDLIRQTKIRPVRDISEFVLSTEKSLIAPRVGKFPLSVEEQSISRSFSENLKGVPGYGADMGIHRQRSLREGAGIISEFETQVMGGTSKRIRGMLGTMTGKKGEIFPGEGQRAVQNLMDRVVVARDMEATINTNRQASFRAPGKFGEKLKTPDWMRTPLSETFRRKTGRPESALPRPGIAGPRAIQKAPEEAMIRNSFTAREVPEGLPTFESYNPFRRRAFTLMEEEIAIAPAASRMIERATGRRPAAMIDQQILPAQGLSRMMNIAQEMKPVDISFRMAELSRFQPVDIATFRGFRQGFDQIQQRIPIRDNALLWITEPISRQALRLDPRFDQKLIQQQILTPFRNVRLPEPLQIMTRIPRADLYLPTVPGGYGGGGGGARGRQSWENIQHVGAMRLVEGFSEFPKPKVMKMPKIRTPKFRIRIPRI